MFSNCCKDELQVISSPVPHPIQDPMQDYALDLVVLKSGVSSSACFCLWEQRPFWRVQAVFLWIPLSLDSEYTFLAGTLELMLHSVIVSDQRAPHSACLIIDDVNFVYQAKVGCARFSTVKWRFSLYLFKLKKLLYFWLCWVFVAVHRLSLVAESEGYSLVEVHGFLIVAASLAVGHGLKGACC